MSTAVHILKALKDGELFPFKPRLPAPSKRALYLTKEAHDNLTGAGTVLSALGRQSFVKADLARWVEGDLVYDGEGRRNGYMLQLDPPPEEIWEVRITCPRPQVRLFGRFAGPDILIGMQFHTRDMLDERGPEWTRAMQRCAQRWDAIFPDTPPFVGATIHDYVTDKCDPILLAAQRAARRRS